MTQFRRRDEGPQQPNTFQFLAQLLGGVAQLQQAHEADFEAKQTELGTTAIKRAAAERDALMAGVADPDAKIDPKQKARIQQRIGQLDKVATADPLTAAQLMGQVNANLPDGIKSPTNMLTNLQQKVQLGDRTQLQRETVAERRAAEKLADANNAFTAEQNDINRAHEMKMSDIQFEQTLMQGSYMGALEDAQTLRGILAARDSTPKEKAAAQADLENLVQSNPLLANLNWVTSATNLAGTTSEGALAARAGTEQAAAASGRTANLQNEVLSAELVGRELQNDSQRYINENVQPYEFQSLQFEDTQTLAGNLDAAAAAGDLNKIRQAQHFLSNPTMYPFEAGQLRKAGVTMQALERDLGAARSVRNHGEAGRVFERKQMDLTLDSIRATVEGEEYNVLSNFAQNFDSVESLRQSLKDLPGRAKRFTPEERSTLEAIVSSRQRTIAKTDSGLAMETLLNAGPPANPETFMRSFIGNAVAAGMDVETARSIGEQALGGWEREGREFDANMVLSQVQTNLALAQVEEAQYNLSVAPLREARDVETHELNVAATVSELQYQEALTNYQNVLSNQALTEEEREAALHEARVGLTEAQTRAADARARASDASANSKEGTTGYNPEMVRAETSRINGLLEGVKLRGISAGCFAAPTGTAAEQEQARILSGLSRAEGADANPDCASIFAAVDTHTQELANLGTGAIAAVTAEKPVKLNGEFRPMPVEAFTIGQQVNAKTAEMNEATDPARKRALGREVNALWQSFSRALNTTDPREAEDAYTTFFNNPFANAPMPEQTTPGVRNGVTVRDGPPR